MPMSTPTLTPTKPAPMPPASVKDLKASSAATSTFWFEPGVSEPLTVEFASMNALTSSLWRIVTPTGMATPTKPAPTLSARPKMFSLEWAWTARPWKPPTGRRSSVPRGLEPFEMPLSALPWVAAASIVSCEPIDARVSFVTEATLTPTPTPTRPPATPAVSAEELRVVARRAPRRCCRRAS